MKPFKIKVKDVKEFMHDQLYEYASGQGKKFFVALRAGPNVGRYVVEVGGTRQRFIKLGDAVRAFNGI